METSDKMCRCCMDQSKDTDMLTIFREMEASRTLLELLLQAVPHLKISQDDQLPQHICANCEQEVKNINKFQEKCLKTEAKLHKIIIGGYGINETNWIEYDIKLEDKPVANVAFEHQEISDDIDLESCSEFAIDMASNTENDSEDENINKRKKSRQLNIEVSKRKAATDEEMPSGNMKEKHAKNYKQPEEVDKIESCSDYSIDMIWSNDEGNEGIESGKNRKKKKRKNNEIHTCDKCEKNYTSKANLARHQLMHEPKKLICNVCEKAFRRADRLKDHMKLHTNDKPFLCPECGKRFISSYILSRHQIRHSNERKFACAHCPKCFRTNADLSAHLISHKVNIKPHVCDECGRVFSRQFLLKQHKLYHSKERNFQCDFCEKRFYTNEKLQCHRRIHTGEKPYKCTFCDKAYIQTNELIKHLRIHLGENIYQCKLCPLRFPNVKTVKEHFNSHINDDKETRAELMHELNALDVKGLDWK